jgi:hypothetical protein
VGNSHFEEVTAVVQFMPGSHVGELQVRRSYGEECAKVPVSLLAPEDAINDPIDTLPEDFVITIQGQRIDGSFQTFVQIRVVGVIPSYVTLKQTGRLVKIRDVALLFKATERMGDRHRVVFPKARSPERTVQPHLIDSHWPQNSPVSNALGRSGCWPCERRNRHYSPDHAIENPHGSQLAILAIVEMRAPIEYDDTAA